ncbi:MAG TPA: 7-carboxy-7-deazaguanine synthase [Thermoanaerobaculia bacterium]|nr:7-carboxy-7-deazaguanine synthase [Thermoanaerobaculia bacterium]
MTYVVKEIFYTLQGEGANAGRPSVFCRFTGCNLWTGLERDRATAACRFCDTDFVGIDGPGGGRFDSAEELATAIDQQWPNGHRRARPFVVCTGGEPLLQVDDDLVHALHDVGFTVAVETNGTRPAPAGIDWLCVSPKAGVPLILQSGDELKVVFPQDGIDPSTLEDLDFRHFFLQPMDGPEGDRNTKAAVAYCLNHPVWRLSLQTHKYLGVP